MFPLFRALRVVSRGLTLTALAALCAAVGALTLGVAQASAELVHPFVGAFEVSSNSFPTALTVQQSTEDVFVFDSGIEAIAKFNAAGGEEDFSSLGSNTIDQLGQPELHRAELAVSSSGPSAGDVFFANGSVVQIFSASGSKIGELTEAPAAGAPWGEPCGVAVDPAGNVYVGLYPESVNEYTPTGSVVTNANYNASMVGLTGACQLAADSEGSVYVDSYPEGPVTKYAASQFAVAPLAASGTVIDASGSSVAVDPSTTELFVDNEEGIAQYSGAGTLLGRSGNSGPGALSFSHGVAVNGAPGGELYAIDFDGESGSYRIDRFGPAVVQAEAVTEPASNVTPTSATVNGTVNPAGLQVATCQFEYGTAEGVFPHSAPCSPAPGEGTAAVPVSAALSGLAPGTTYHYRLAATNANGTNNGSEETFFTPTAPQVRDEAAEVKSAEPAGQTTATLQGQVDPGGAEATYHFEYDTREYKEGEAAHGTSVPAPDGMLEASQVFVSVPPADLTGLTRDTTYHYRLVAHNAYGTASGPDQLFTTLGALLIDSESVSEVGATSARLVTQLNPLGSPTEYHFEYDTREYKTGEASHGTNVPTPEGSAGEGVGEFSFNLLVEELTPGTTYYYRVVAHNSLGVVVGPGHSFTTRGPAAPGLIDGRGWEMVSPPDKHGVSLEVSGEEGGLIQASEDGSALTYFAEAPIDSEPAGSRSFAYSQLLSKRNGPGAWSTQDIATPNEELIGLTAGNLSEYKLFSADLSVGLVEPQTATPLSPQATERTPYVRESADGEFTPLLTAANVPPGVKFGGEKVRGEEFVNGSAFVTATPGFNHVVLRSSMALTEDFKSGQQNSGQNSLYEWSAGKLQLVSILRDTTPAAEEGLSSSLGAGNYGVRNAVSASGTRAVFRTEGNNEQHLYMRDMDSKETVQLDVPEAGAASEGRSEPIYMDATSDGSKVFFLDGQRLTVNASATREVPDLYMCEIARVESKLSCALKDLTVPLKAGESANVLGADLGIDETGRYVYFVANGVLAAGATPGDCAGSSLEQRPPPSLSCNLYVHDTTTGETRLIAVLANLDAPDWQAGFERRNLFSELTARVSPDGRYVAFMSQRSLTGYDNRDARSGRLDEEVFLYHAPNDLASEPGTLVCVSCNPTGARPDGLFDPSYREPPHVLPPLVDRPNIWGEQWLAGSIPGWPLVDDFHALHEPRNLFNSGRLFFNSADALVPSDANGKDDVYEYEPYGVGSCRLVTGCIGLISSGTSDEESGFLDASGEGEDVFLMTAAKLVSEDIDHALDVYDAHVCSTGSPCPATAVSLPPACSTADSCRVAPAPQPTVFGAPPSATFQGTGNLSPSVVKPKTVAQLKAEKLAKALRLCRKIKAKKKRARCKALAKRKYGVSSARKSARPGRRGKRS
jgi:hypothetical protein